MQKKQKKQTLESQIRKTENQIKFLELIFRAIKKFQERKNRRGEEMELDDLENSLKNIQ